VTGKSQTEILGELLEKVEKQLTGSGEVKVTLADYVRLVQLKRELDEEEPKEIRVTWKDTES
jgi:hypothetical protein